MPCAVQHVDHACSQHQKPLPTRSKCNASAAVRDGAEWGTTCINGAVGVYAYPKVLMEGVRGMNERIIDWGGMVSDHPDGATCGVQQPRLQDWPWGGSMWGQAAGAITKAGGACRACRCDLAPLHTCTHTPSTPHSCGLGHLCMQEAELCWRARKSPKFVNWINLKGETCGASFSHTEHLYGERKHQGAFEYPFTNDIN